MIAIDWSFNERGRDQHRVCVKISLTLLKAPRIFKFRDALSGKAIAVFYFWHELGAFCSYSLQS